MMDFNSILFSLIDEHRIVKCITYAILAYIIYKLIRRGALLYDILNITLPVFFAFFLLCAVGSKTLFESALFFGACFLFSIAMRNYDIFKINQKRRAKNIAEKIENYQIDDEKYE